MLRHGRAPILHRKTLYDHVIWTIVLVRLSSVRPRCEEGLAYGLAAPFPQLGGSHVDFA